MEKRELITDLEYKIHTLRNRMIYTAQLKGLNHSDTIERSKELDFLLNKYGKITEKKANTISPRPKC